MFPSAAFVVVLTLLHFTCSQEGFYAPPGAPVPGVAGSGSAPTFIGGPVIDGDRQFLGGVSGSGFQRGSAQAQNVFISDNDPDTFPGVAGGVVGAVPTFGVGVTGQSIPGVISLPAQGAQFLAGQGGSFVDNRVFGQTGGQVSGFGFPSSVIRELVDPTVTRTVTVNAFTTLTDLVLVSEPVTNTQFSLRTTTRLTRVVVPTPVNHALALSTSVVFQPAYVTLTETTSDFRVVVRTSVKHVTLTHTSYVITHVPFTLTATETVKITSPVVRTDIITSVVVVSNYYTFTNTVYVHGGYH